MVKMETLKYVERVSSCMTQMHRQQKLEELEERAEEIDTAIFCSAVEDATYLKIKNPHTRAEVEQGLIGYAVDGKSEDKIQIEPAQMDTIIDDVLNRINE